MREDFAEGFRFKGNFFDDKGKIFDDKGKILITKTESEQQ